MMQKSKPLGQAVEMILMTPISHRPACHMQLNENPPALAGTVQGVVVHMAAYKFGNSCSRPLNVALTNLNMAYMLLETCFSGYYIEIK